MASKNSRLLRPITTHRQTQGILMGCPHRPTGVRQLGRRIELTGRRPQVIVHRPKGEGMTLVRVKR